MAKKKTSEALRVAQVPIRPIRRNMRSHGHDDTPRKATISATSSTAASTRRQWRVIAGLRVGVIHVQCDGRTDS
jgi:hypothetical protein